MPKFRECKIGDLIDIITPKKRFNANTLTFGGRYRYVVRSENNNGIRGYIDEDERYLNPANTISFGQDTATMFFQNAPYFTGDKIKVFSLREKTLTREIAMYLIAVMKKGFQTFGWGRSSFSVNTLKEVKIQLPYNLDNEVDFEYMTTFIHKLEVARIRELEAYLRITGLSNHTVTDQDQKLLSDYYGGGASKSKSFKIGDIFYKKEMPHEDSRSYRVKERDIHHNIAGVVAKCNDNGVMYWVNEDEFMFTTDQDAITIIVVNKWDALEKETGTLEKYRKQALTTER